MENEIKREVEKAGQNLELMPYLAEVFSLKQQDLRTFSPLTLAYIGDGIYDIIIRTIVVNHGNAPVNKLHKEVSGLVKANAQVRMLHAIEEQLTEEEHSVYKRGRNAKSFTSAKNASITDYRIATGFEALMGYLYLANRMDRLVALLQYGLENMEK